jgi:hypothetical protein
MNGKLAAVGIATPAVLALPLYRASKCVSEPGRLANFSFNLAKILPNSRFVSSFSAMPPERYYITLHYIHSTDRHVLAIMQADLCRAHPHNQEVMSLYLLKA